MSNEKYDYLFKLLILGRSNVGKQSFILRFLDDDLSKADHYTPSGIFFKIKIINFQNKNVKLQIWDTGAEKRIESITKTYFKATHGIILMYDVTDRNSFNA